MKIKTKITFLTAFLKNTTISNEHSQNFWPIIIRAGTVPVNIHNIKTMLHIGNTKKQSRINARNTVCMFPVCVSKVHECISTSMSGCP